MKVSELIARLKELNQDADVLFDTEAQTYDVHLVPVDAAWPIGPEEGMGREIVYLSEDAPHRGDDRDARIVALETALAAAYLEMRKQWPAITAVYDRDVWNAAKAAGGK